MNEWGEFAAGYLMGYHTGYDAGVAAAEDDMAEAWAAAVHRVRTLAQPDDYTARVAAAERHCRALAARQWQRREAWESAARASKPRITADDLTRALRVRLPDNNRRAA